MWNSFFRAFFVLGVVWGIEEIFFGIYLSFKQKRVMSLRWVLRGTASVIVFSISLWFFKGRTLTSSDFEILATTFLPLVLATFGIEAYLKVRLEGKSFSAVFEKPKAENETPRVGTKKLSKMRFTAAFGLVFGLFFLTPAIVYSIVAPELLRPYWWPMIILFFTILGFVVGSFQWNANEKRLGSKANGF